ncbi:hypothetical protein PENANT_c036G01094 [Penicillium antarcticum]|uniref:Uncharacterized protein n=1 Tax=Penicillium antarcticum TaxID=416450 RepID=A0A1V6PTP6_9EURO|nr:uncharacterized protein N7508_001997 [Penicillium antarcticum]KAJ5317489.1 hypothetical protein N7508_001997 [Penicillium antarcticum]OQD80390.1 hypothetical protein PENANT_c036G01094 [Penicillium antarcticum]
MTTLNGAFNSAPDTPSAIYPDRLIRPLPKRTLRSRLSSDAADTIFYPPTPPASQIFYGVSEEEAVNESKVYVQQTVEGHELSPEIDHTLETAVEIESGDEDGPVVVRRSAGFRSSSPSSSHHEGPPKSSGPDGYDAFENTNNKKKRKIPTPGNLGHSALSPEFANMGLTSSTSAPPPPEAPTGTYYGTGNPASPLAGISGSGRGRLSRSTVRTGNSRGPLSANAQNGWMTARTPRRDGLMSSPGPTGESPSDQGIISTAIANAATLSSPPQGPSNLSLLDQENTTPTKTQFTFTCESDSSKGMAMQRKYSIPHRSPTSPLGPASHNARGFSTQGTQTSPSMAASMNGPPGTQPPAQGAEQHPAGPKKKRSPGSIYALSARQRKIQQQYTNLHHPPSLEDIWICEFCEYESIFGRPPEALIRQYEMKDRKERKRLAEKKRLLEKAKMKGRKTKKATKNASKNSSHPYQQGFDRASVDHSSATGSGLHDDEYLGHEYDDEQSSIPASAPASPTDLKPPLPPGNYPKINASAPGIKGAADSGASRPA